MQAISTSESSVHSQPWQWPLDLTKYDRSPWFTQDEEAELAVIMSRFRAESGILSWHGKRLPHLERVLVPIQAVLDYARCPEVVALRANYLLLKEMHQRKTIFWAWSEADWLEILATNPRIFRQKQQLALETRLYVVTVAYLLCSFNQLEALEGLQPYVLAQKVFGRQTMARVLDSITTLLKEKGYGDSHFRSMQSVLSYVLLLNRSPLLSAIPFELLQSLQKSPMIPYRKRFLVSLLQALVKLDILRQPLEILKPREQVQLELEREIKFRSALPTPGEPAAPGPARKWLWPVEPTKYDRNPQLTADECKTIAVMMAHFDRGVRVWRSGWRKSLKRILDPIYAALSLDPFLDRRRISNVGHVLLQEMHNRQTSFWAWSVTDWLEVIGSTQSQFRQEHRTSTASRQLVVVVAYLLVEFKESEVLQSVGAHYLAQKVFGRVMVAEAVQPVINSLDELGYRKSHHIGVKNLLCTVLLLNRSPLLTDITLELLTSLEHSEIASYLKESAFPLSRALTSLEILPRPLRSLYPSNWALGAVSQSGTASQLQTGLSTDKDRAVNQPTLTLQALQEWQWPIDVSVYDRQIELSKAEQSELAVMMSRFKRGILPWRKASREILQRLLGPIYDTLGFMGAKTEYYSGVTHLLLEEMHFRQISFWGWSELEWLQTLGQHAGDFLQRHRRRGREALRQYVAGVAYLLGNFESVVAIERLNPYPLASKVFGKEAVDLGIQTVHNTLTSWGYAPARYNQIKNLLCVIFLSNRNPQLNRITLELLENLQRSEMQDYLKPDLVSVSRALVNLEILPHPLAALLPTANPGATTTSVVTVVSPSGKATRTLANIDSGWVEWCQRWRDTSTLEPKTRRSFYYSLLQVGRWLTQTHPEVNSPAQWDRLLAAEYVAAVGQMVIGQWRELGNVAPEKLGKPVTPRHQAHLLSAIRTFFRDCLEWGWISLKFNPQRSLTTPRSVQAKIGPNPRVIADDVWAKLLSAGLTLSREDFWATDSDQSGLSHRGNLYPIELLRALAVVWLFAGLRSDEISRLRVGCVHWAPLTISEGEVGRLSENGEVEVKPPQVCLLDIPVNKTSTAFTKPVDRIVGEAIAIWEKVRPIQPAMLDPKTNELVHYLFAYRARRVARTYLNEAIIPTLCDKAGVPHEDARGNITSHRARSTIASQLANAKEPMSLFELQAWLGHKHVNTTRSYLKSSPTKLAQAYADADYFKRNLRTIEVLIDQDVIKSGATTKGEPWRFYDLGHGYCTYDFFDQCPHRMACAKCAFYRAKGSSQAQMLEAKTNLLKMKQEIPLSEEEVRAVDDGLEALGTLIEKLLDTPTPAGPTPRQLENIDNGKKDKKAEVLPLILRPVKPKQISKEYE